MVAVYVSRGSVAASGSTDAHPCTAAVRSCPKPGKHSSQRHAVLADEDRTSLLRRWWMYPQCSRRLLTNALYSVALGPRRPGGVPGSCQRKGLRLAPRWKITTEIPQSRGVSDRLFLECPAEALRVGKFKTPATRGRATKLLEERSSARRAGESDRRNTLM